MNKLDIGVDVDDFHLPTKESLRKAADLAFRTVELATVAGEVAPSNLSTSGRRHLARYVNGLGLKMAALVGDMPRLRLTDAASVDERVERTCGILDLAADLKVPIVTAAAGALTHPETCAPAEEAVSALKRIGEHADLRGVVYALRPSYDSGERLVGLLDELSCPSIQICLDPASMVMAGANPLSRIERFVEQIALLHARDGAAGLAERPGYETRLGEGEVDLVTIFAMLDAAEYRGSYIIRRRDSQSPVSDIQDARNVLTKLLPQV